MLPLGFEPKCVASTKCQSMLRKACGMHLIWWQLLLLCSISRPPLKSWYPHTIFHITALMSYFIFSNKPKNSPSHSFHAYWKLQAIYHEHCMSELTNHDFTMLNKAKSFYRILGMHTTGLEWLLFIVPTSKKTREMKTWKWGCWVEKLLKTCTGAKSVHDVGLAHKRAGLNALIRSCANSMKLWKEVVNTILVPLKSLTMFKP